MNEEVKSSEERIQELEKRVATLEAIEKRRKVKMIIGIALRVVMFIIIIITIIKLYLYVKPYFEQLSQLSDFKNSLNLNGNDLKNFDLSNFDLNSLFQ